MSQPPWVIPIRGFGNALNLGPYLHVLSLGGIGNALDLGALPYFKYYLCVGPIRGFGNAFDIVPYPTTTWYYPCARPSRGFGNAFNLGPYATCTILVWDRKSHQPWALPYYM